MAVVNSGICIRVVEDTLSIRLADADSIAPANDSIIDLSIHGVGDSWELFFHVLSDDSSGIEDGDKNAVNNESRIHILMLKVMLMITIEV